MIPRDGGPVPERTRLFGAGWCADCRRAKSWLRRNAVPFAEFDTDADPVAREQAVSLAGGRTNIPVVVTPDGTVLVEPATAELAEALAPHAHHRHRSGCR